MILFGHHIPHSKTSTSLSLRLFMIYDVLLYILLASIVSRNDMMVFVEARFKRCFTCRSRGALGDCRDPFTLNSTTFDGQTNHKPSIEATPCASGWCAKTIEDNFGESIAATERSCMTRPPTDNAERCSETIFENQKDKKIFLCMCYGDLCNSATGLFTEHSFKLIVIMTLLTTMTVTFCSNLH